MASNELNWIELIRDDSLMQGDIFEKCPMILPSKDLPYPIVADIEDNDVIKVGLPDAIVISQSCDLVEAQKLDMWLVIFCPIYTLSEVSEINSFLASGFGREECRRGHMPGYHMIKQFEDKQWSREISIVSFRELWGLPLDYVRSMANKMKIRPRLKSPYREHLAQAFARYFMRVGLPADIQPFETEKNEFETAKRLNALSEDARNRVLKPFIDEILGHTTDTTSSENK